MENVSELVRFSRYARNLYVHRDGQGTWLNDMLRDNDFSSLRELEFGSELNSKLFQLQMLIVVYVSHPSRLQ